MPHRDQLADLCEEAEEALAEGDAEAALEAADEALSLAAGDPVALLLKAEALYMMEDDAEADEAFQQAIRDHADDPVVMTRALALRLSVLPDDAEDTLWALETIPKVRRLVPEDDVEGLAVSLARLEGVAHGLDDALEASHAAFARAVQLAGDAVDDDLQVELACALFHLCRFGECRQILEQVVQHDREHAEAIHWLALVAEFTGDVAGARRHAERARKLDPDSFPEPLRLTDGEMSEAVEQALAQVPAEVRRWLANVPIIVEPLPNVDDLKGPPALSPLSLGLFKGPVGPGVEAARTVNELPCEIHLYQRNLERYAEDRDALRGEIEETLLHEIGHFVGWDEDELHERGLH